ncbi:MAG: hypothetical protein K6T85_16840, partial [Gorillibacterium sp.]|nr:hypothetical protein [Gorillibacterium sp.]
EVNEMIPLDNYEKWLPLMADCARLYLNVQELKEYSLISQNEVGNQLKALLERPIARFTIVNEVYFRARWAEVLKALGPQDNLKLLEVATGDADMIPQVMARTHPNSHYITANMNKHLNKSLLAKTKVLPLKLEIIEDDAAYVENHLGQEAVDLIAFQHAINDVIQAILCDREGVDTIHSDWMETLPKMIEILQKETAQNTLEEHAKISFLGLIDTLLKILKTNGIIAMNHYMFQLDLDWGYPPDLFKTMVPMTREWMKEIKGCKEIFLDGFDSNWWIFLQKV